MPLWGSPSRPIRSRLVGKSMIYEKQAKGIGKLSLLVPRQFNAQIDAESIQKNDVPIGVGGTSKLQRVRDGICKFNDSNLYLACWNPGGKG